MSLGILLAILRHTGVYELAAVLLRFTEGKEMQRFFHDAYNHSVPHSGDLGIHGSIIH